jgi:lambda family phage portal protein
MDVRQNVFDLAIGWFAPRYQLKRTLARVANDRLIRHYDAAANSRRTQGWSRASGDANSINARALATIRDRARELIRNNGQMRQALRTIANHTVGWGIKAKAVPMNERAMTAWNKWAETTACDADGRDDFYGLQKLVIRGVAESGEMLVRRRFRLPSDGLPIPLQLQVLEPDYLDTSKHGITLQNGGRIVHGIEFDAIGRRAAYWLFQDHPGDSSFFRNMTSQRIPAEGVLHVFERERAGQHRAVSWFAAEILPANDLEEYADAQRMKQKIAACLSVITSDLDGSAAALGVADDSQSPGIDMLEPGAILNVPAGRSVEVVQPPTVGDYGPYVSTEQRKLAKGIGLSYEDFTGDYSNVNFSSARMARIEHHENVHDWRWRLVVPQFCNPVWGWAMQAAAVANILPAIWPDAQWTPPPMAMIEPDKEGLAIMRNVRAGIQTLPDALRERGYDPADVFKEMAEANAMADAFGLKLDSDPRYMTQAGQLQGDSGSGHDNKARE